ncbi:tetratricopeptide repeat protein [Marinoscillum sp. MHG1-6]|uniref:tetratricopeptide repeat protein n=1 Tax=Marinoscillum sp. MHG1-6 TaxID=2959627 RepID=UPI0021575904|nr:tetratricopeptide repeat protein [Marinoscillum sp. MHG1-6]
MKILTGFLMIITFCATAQVDQAKLGNEYFQKGELQKAEEIYQELYKNPAALPLIYSNYLDLLLRSEEHKSAESLIKSAQKYFPSNTQYQVGLLKLYEVSSQTDEQDKYLKKLRKEYGDNNFALANLAKYMANQQLNEFAIDFYKEAREISRTSYAYALELAALYRAEDMRDSMMDEYLNYASINTHGLAYVKNLFQSILQDEQDQNFLEQTLIRRMQDNPSDMMYPDLIIWLEIQRKNFYSAFIQARAMDKRMNKPGEKCLSVARIAMENEDWDTAILIFEYVIKNYADSRNYPSARTLSIQARENKVKKTYPVDKQAIRILSEEYQQLYDELGSNPYTLEAIRSKALLHAFYLDEIDSAISKLNFVVSNRRSPPNLISRSKLDLGDIYLLSNEPWESTLLYSQVEKSDKSSPVGYEAKLRNAKLNYYTGNFALAKDHLDILKMATTKEIANDAIALSLLIQNNTVFDTTDLIMQKYANIELLVFQNRKSQAIDQFVEMLQNYPDHSLVDEVHWQLSKLNLEMGNFQKSIDHLDQIINNFFDDVLADDAQYQKGVILADYLHDDEKALKVLIDFLKKHPGSLFSAEARSRVRVLRGDEIN